MKIATYTSRNYTPEGVRKRYVSCQSVKNQLFNWCEVGDNGLDLRQGRVSADELTEEIRKAAEQMSGQAYAYVEWPS